MMSQPFGNQFIQHLLRQARPGLELVDHDAFDLKAFVVVFLQLFDFCQQMLDELIAEGLPVLPVYLASSVRMRESHQESKPLMHRIQRD